MQPHEGDSKEQLLALVQSMTVIQRVYRPEAPWDVAEELVVAILLAHPNTRGIAVNRLPKALKELLPERQVKSSELHVLGEISQDLLTHVLRALSQQNNLYDS